tara:strand:+ start:8180 stop:9523 length:1344 start_codon:yes stop_codon:yes gene_type:complete
MPTKPILIKNGRAIDPTQNLDSNKDILIENGIISQISNNITHSTAEKIDAKGLIVSPGFIDLHCHLREPGYESSETIKTGTAAAAAGGYTTICAMPNTNPTIDSKVAIKYVQQESKKNGYINVLPIGAVTKNREGIELSPMIELADLGAIGFSDDGNPVYDANIMRQALNYSTLTNTPIINHCEVLELSKNGLINEGIISTRLGVKGIPGAAESIMAYRDIQLCELTGGKLHIAHVSTKSTLDIIKQAKESGINVTCEVTPHHITLTEDLLLGKTGSDLKQEALNINSYDTNAKVKPPLRNSFDVKSMIDGIKNGIIDFIATDHAPHKFLGKNTTLENAEFGISNIETSLTSSLSLYHNDNVPLPLIIDKLSSSPAKFLNISNIGNLNKGSKGDITIFDPNKIWTINYDNFYSKGKNTPINGYKMKGKVITTIVSGKIIYEKGKIHD